MEEYICTKFENNGSHLTIYCKKSDKVLKRKVKLNGHANTISNKDADFLLKLKNVSEYPYLASIVDNCKKSMLDNIFKYKGESDGHQIKITKI